MKKALIFVLVIVVVSLVLFFSSSKDDKTTEIMPELRPDLMVKLKTKLTNVMESTKSNSINYQASFAIFTNDNFRIFTKSMYHNLSSDVYIEAKAPNVVRVRREEVTWNDFFETLPFELTKECLITGTDETFCNNANETLKFYLNGVKVDDLLEKEIKSGDKVLITFGSESEAQIKEQLSRVPSPQ